MKKLFRDKFNLKANKIKPGKRWAYVNFGCEEDKNYALQVLSGYVWKNCTLKVKSARPAKDPLLSLKKSNNTNVDENLTAEERIIKAVTPYAEFDYEEQVRI